MAIESFQDFLNVLDWPRIAFFYLYYATRLIMYTSAAVYTVVRACLTNKKKKPSVLMPACYKLRLNKYFYCFMRWLSLHAFGDSGTLITRADEYQPDEFDEYGFPKLYIDKHQLTYHNILAISVFVISSIILVAIAVFHVWGLKLTHVCSNSPDIHCFPQLANPDNPLNLTISTESRITDCSKWTNQIIAREVQFSCFEFSFNILPALGLIGGLYVIIPAIMNLISTVLLFLFQHCCFCGHRVSKALRYTFAVFVFIIDLTSVSLATNFLIKSHMNDSDHEMTQDTQILRSHVVHIVLIMSTIGTAFFIPWETIVKRNREFVADHDIDKVV